MSTRQIDYRPFYWVGGHAFLDPFCPFERLMTSTLSVYWVSTRNGQIKLIGRENNAKLSFSHSIRGEKNCYERWWWKSKEGCKEGKKKNRQSNPPDKILPFFLNWREETDNWWSWAVPIIWINASHCWSQKDGLGVESLIGDIRCFKVVPDSRRFSWICSRRDGSLYRSVWISWEGIMLFRWTLVHLFIAIDWMDEDNSLVNKKLSWDNLDLTDIESSRFYLLTDRSRWAERGEGLIKLPKTYVKIAVQIRDGDENDANMGRTAAINSIRKTSWRQTWEKKTTPVLSFRVDFDHQMVLDKKREHSYSTLLILVQSA